MNALQALKWRQSIAPTTSAVTTQRTAAIDCAGDDYVTLIINPSVESAAAATGIVISVLHSDDTVVTNHATILANRTEDLTTTHNIIYHIPVRKRYLRLTVTPDTTTNGPVVISAISVCGHSEERPASTSGMVGSTNDVVVVVS